ncbi:FkbM family methyltransferase [Nocardioides zhouii]|uniref:FkbM family methyltransferase n=1 Tax=Nocardioides zhouii TaxID=1168729 RepID=UPI0013ED50AE|nr:FkbM family methyltransferase [Nocardioides zhouii]
MSQLVARTIIGVAKSLKDTTANRHLSVVRWSPTRQAWIHRWPGGLVIDRKRWSTPEEWATNGDYDMPDLLWTEYQPKPGDTVIDVGAGHGGETYFLASMVGERGKVLAVEAAPRPFGRLQEMVEINGWEHVHPVQVALSDRVGTVRITDDEDNWIAANIYADATDGVDVSATTFDDLCQDHGITTVDWVKMNIEGAEKDAIRGMERMAPHVRHMTIACHDWLGTEWGRSREQVLTWLHDHGFRTRLHGRENTWDGDYVHAWRD